MGNTRHQPRTPATTRRRGRPATTPEERENQLISLATDLTEQQLREGTASAQVITHYLKLGSSRERLEQSKIEGENKLLLARIEREEAAVRIESLYADALNAFRGYQGRPPELEDSDEYDDDYY